MHATEERTVVEIQSAEPGSEGGGTLSAAPAPLRVTTRTPVTDAREALDRSGELLALVTHRGVDVGIVTAQELAPGATGADTVGDVMGHEVVFIDPTSDLQTTLRTYTRAAWSSAIRRRPGR
jgi:CBS domain-containing protein